MPVTTSRTGHVLVISINRPERRNAIDAEATAGIDAALNTLADDEDLRVGVITGTTEFFSAGTDMAAGPGGPTERGGEYGVIRRHRTEPLIAAVEGFAVGGGMEIVLACDLVVAGRGASFGLPEAARGVIATCGGLFRTHRALPPNIANDMLLTGRSLTAERAHQVGFVNELTNDGSALEGALELAALVAAGSPTSTRATVVAARESTAAADRHGWDATARAIDAVVGSADQIEGVTAFFERRPPRWTSR